MGVLQSVEMSSFGVLSVVCSPLLHSPPLLAAIAEKCRQARCCGLEGACYVVQGVVCVNDRFY